MYRKRTLTHDDIMTSKKLNVIFAFKRYSGKKVLRF